MFSYFNHILIVNINMFENRDSPIFVGSVFMFVLLEGETVVFCSRSAHFCGAFLHRLQLVVGRLQVPQEVVLSKHLAAAVGSKLSVLWKKKL